MKNEDKAYTGTQNWKDYKKSLEAKPKVIRKSDKMFSIDNILVTDKELIELLALSKENAILTEDEKVLFVTFNYSGAIWVEEREYSKSLIDEFDQLMALRDDLHKSILSGEKVITSCGIYAKLGLTPYIHKDADGEVRAYEDNTDSDDMVGLMSALFNGNPQMATMMVDKMYESIPSSMVDPNKSKLDNLKDYMEMTK